ALVDVCRLARAMTYKHAVCGHDLGGGKAVSIGDPATLRSEALFRAYGRFVEGLNGRYITAEDVGTTQAGMDLVRREAPCATGLSESLGGSGDPSPATAWGVLWAMKAVAERLWGSPSLAGRHVCISGLGKVGATLARHLAEEGAKLTVADVRPEAVDAVVEQHGAVPVAPEQAHAVPCDIFSPCALGGVLDATTVPELRCDAVVGSANNQLATPADAERLRHRGIIYAPDFVANAGGVINIAEEPHGYDRQRAYDRIRSIYDTLLAVFDRADAEGTTTAEAADRIARERIAAVGATRLLRAGAWAPGGCPGARRGSLTSAAVALALVSVVAVVAVAVAVALDVARRRTAGALAAARADVERLDGQLAAVAAERDDLRARAERDEQEAGRLRSEAGDLRKQVEDLTMLLEATTAGRDGADEREVAGLWQLLRAHVTRRWAAVVGVPPDGRTLVDGGPADQFVEALARETERLREEVGVEVDLAVPPAGPEGLGEAGGTRLVAMLVAALELLGVLATSAQRVTVEVGDKLVITGDGWSDPHGELEVAHGRVAAAGVGVAPLDVDGDRVRLVLRP